MNNPGRNWVIAAVAILLAGGVGAGLWLQAQRSNALAGFATGNGRIEATEVDIATKLAGRLEEVRVEEGDSVEAGQIVARMETKSLQAMLKQAEAEVTRARKGRNYAAAVIEQRQSELALAKKELARARGLYENQNIALEKLQRGETVVRSAKASLAAAEAQLAETDAAIEAAKARTEQLKADLEDSILTAPRGGRILYRLAEPGEVLPAGGKVLTLLDLTDVYMTVFLPTAQAGRVAIGAEARIVLDTIAEYTLPARVSFVAPRAQFTPKEVETRTEREKLMFRVKIRIDPELLKQHVEQVKTGVPGVAYVRLDAAAEWPKHLQVRLP